MSAATQAPAAPIDPDPPRAAPAMPAGIGRVLSLVRKLIDYGRQLAATVQQRATAPGFALFASTFGTADLATILARITNGLHRAVALEARLNQRAARGQDLKPSAAPLPAAYKPRAARRSAEPQSADLAQDPRLALLPTEAEIAARLATGLDPVVRHRPVGAVIADICRDLGIAPGDLDRAFWDELSLAIIEFGGSLSGFIADLNKRMFVFHAGERSDHADPPWTAPEPATGPP
jgi:hypothetical protein